MRAADNTEFPLVTIGIPTYNQDKYILQAVESALNQDYPNLQIIVADDNSTDSTQAIISSYLGDKRLVYQKNTENIGRVSNYRKLLYEYAIGEWYVNLDGDDYFTDSSFISKSIGWIKQHENIVMVSAGCDRLTLKGNSHIKTSGYEGEVSVVNGRQFFLDLPSEKGWFSHLATLYNRKRAMELDFYRENILSTDYESIYRLMLTGNVVCYKKAVGAWRMHTNNASVNKFSDPRNIFDNFRYVENSVDFAKSHFSYTLLKRWRNLMLKNNIRGNLSIIFKQRPRNSIRILSGLILKHPLHFSLSLFEMVRDNTMNFFSGKHSPRLSPMKYQHTV